MQKLLITFSAILFSTIICFSQIETNEPNIKREGFSMGFGIGAGLLSLQAGNQTKFNFTPSLPNLKIGYAFNQNFMLALNLPGAMYSEDGLDRGFEGVLVSGQYWPNNHLWLLGGVGMTFDAPAFYTVESVEEANFNTGLPAMAFGVGYEIWQSGRFTIDLQYRIFAGRTSTNGNRNKQGVANMFLIGFNWY